MTTPLTLHLESLCVARSLSLYRACRLSGLSIGTSSALRRNPSMRTDTLSSLLLTLHRIRPLSETDRSLLLHCLLPLPPSPRPTLQTPSPELPS